jgi:hypothetical protein
VADVCEFFNRDVAFLFHLFPQEVVDDLYDVDPFGVMTVVRGFL